MGAVDKTVIDRQIHGVQLQLESFRVKDVVIMAYQEAEEALERELTPHFVPRLGLVFLYQLPHGPL